MDSTDERAAPYACRGCSTLGCFTGDAARMPAACPTRERPETAGDRSGYLGPERQALMRVADRTPRRPDGQRRNRVEELIFFAKERGMRRVGIASCVSLLKESQELVRQLEAAGLEAELVCCRVGAMDVAEIGLEKARPERFAGSCNPVAQARLLNARGVELVAQVGLCLGHDLILQEECAAPVTTLVVKDRALDHHPVRALRGSPRGM